MNLFTFSKGSFAATVVLFMGFDGSEYGVKMAGWHTSFLKTNKIGNTKETIIMTTSRARRKLGCTLWQIYTLD